MLAGMLAVPLMASVAWADCLKDDPYYRCFDWYHAPPGEVYTPPASVKTLAGAGKMAIAAFAALAERLDALATERASPWWRRLAG